MLDQLCGLFIDKAVHWLGTVHVTSCYVSSSNVTPICHSASVACQTPFTVRAEIFASSVIIDQIAGVLS